MDMIGFPIEWIVALIIGMVVALAVFTGYMVIERIRQNRRKLQTMAYLKRNRMRWYDYLRLDGYPEEELIPKDDAEVMAVEELFHSLVHNLKGDGMEERISGFANRNMASFYRRKLRGHNWGERMNALYRIHDFGIDSLIDDCRKLIKRRVSEEESFLLLLIELKFLPETFINNNLDKLSALSSNDAKELLFGMPEEVFEEIVSSFNELEPNLQYALVDVIGMKLDPQWVTMLDKIIVNTDSELRIRVLRAFNTLSYLPSESILTAATESNVWQERYQAAKLMRWLPEKQAIYYVEKFLEDEIFLIREEARIYKENQISEKISFEQAAADTSDRLDGSPKNTGSDQPQFTEPPGKKGDF